MPPTLLADLAGMMSTLTSPEDVATRALELILQRSAAARTSVTRILDVWRGRPGRPVVRWISQVVADDDARTDLQGFDADEHTVAIFENKFWAGLTDNQPSAYLQRLPTDGILVFLVPMRRVALIANELVVRTRGADGGGAPDFLREGQAEVAHLPSGCTLTVASWGVILKVVGAALEAAEEYDNLADLHQLEGLVAHMEREGFRPFTSMELTGDTPRLFLRLCELVDAATQQFLTRPCADKRGLRSAGGQGWYGQYFRIHGRGCHLGVHAPRWASSGLSPVWLRVSGTNWTFTEQLRVPLLSAIDDPSWLQEDRGYFAGFWIPIRLVEGRDRDAVIRDVLRQLDRVAASLAAAPLDHAGELNAPAMEPPNAAG